MTPLLVATAALSAVAGYLVGRRTERRAWKRLILVLTRGPERRPLR